LYKFNTDKIQFVYQADFPTHGSIGHALREVIFLNHKYKDQIIATLVAGFIYRW
jgi:hypothetical protein